MHSVRETEGFKKKIVFSTNASLRSCGIIFHILVKTNSLAVIYLDRGFKDSPNYKGSQKHYTVSGIY